MAINANIAARKSAETIVELIHGELRQLIDQYALAAVPPFFATLRAAFGPNLTVLADAQPPEPMTDAEAQRFGRQPMPFGKHKGNLIDEVPLDYLVWLAENDTFQAELQRYLRSQRIRAEMRNRSEPPEDEDDWEESDD